MKVNPMNVYVSHSLTALRVLAQDPQPSETERALAALNAQPTQYGSVPVGFCAAYPQEAK